MATATVQSIVNITTTTGNEITIQGHTQTGGTSAATVANATISALNVDVIAHGDVHGMLVFPFADEELTDGALQPSDLKTAQVCLTQGGAGAVVALIAEEITAY